jgi:hypothetical protein
MRAAEYPARVRRPYGRRLRQRHWIMVLVVAAIALLIIPAVLLLGGAQRVMPGSPSGPAGAGKPTANEHYAWRAVAIGGGGFITGLSFDASGRTMLARADVYGAYRWDTADDRWKQLVTAPAMPPATRVQGGVFKGVYEAVVAPNAPRRLYMAVAGRLFRSDDGGAQWREPGPGAPFPFVWDANGEFRHYGPYIAVDPGNADHLFLGTPDKGLWRSLDGGRGWRRVVSVPPAADLRPAPGVQAPGVAIWFEPRRGRVFASSPGVGLFIADRVDGEFRAASGGGPRTIKRASFAANGDFLAIDGEAKQAWVLHADRWRELTGEGGLPNMVFAGVAADPQGRRIIVTDAGGEAWCSADTGVHWAAIGHSQTAGAGDPPWLAKVKAQYFASGQIAFDPGHRDRLWAAAGTGPYYVDLSLGCPRSLDWKSRARGIEELVAMDVVQSPGHAPVFAALDFGIHVKPDLNAYSTTWGPRPRVLIAAQKLDWSASDPAFLVTNASDTRTCCGEDGDAVMAGWSDDGGRNWHKFAALPEPPGTSPDDPWRMAYGTIAVAADKVDNIVWVPAFNRPPYYTLDRGRTWARVVLPGETGDKTGSFEIKWMPRRILAADRVMPGTFYMVHSGDGSSPQSQGVWRTGDGGRHWNRVFEGEVMPNSRYAAKLRAVPGRARHLFFTSAAGSANTRLRRSIDGGESWTAIDGVEHVDDIGFGKAARGSDYPTLFVSGQVRHRYGIWRSVDNARTWQRVAGFPVGRLDQVNVVEGDKDVFGRVYVGYVGSGFLYGQPAPCTAAPLRAADDRQCFAVGSDQD